MLYKREKSRKEFPLMIIMWSLTVSAKFLRWHPTLLHLQTNEQTVYAGMSICHSFLGSHHVLAHHLRLNSLVPFSSSKAERMGMTAADDRINGSPGALATAV